MPPRRALCGAGALIWRWLRRSNQNFNKMALEVKIPYFAAPSWKARQASDDRIERSLAQRAAGIYFPQSESIQLRGLRRSGRHDRAFPPDVSACKLWLHNRRSDMWREKSEVKIDSDGSFLKLWGATSDGTIN